MNGEGLLSENELLENLWMDRGQPPYFQKGTIF